MALPRALEQDNLELGIKQSEKAFQELSQAIFGTYFSASAQTCNEVGCFIPMKVMDVDLKKLVIANGGTYYSAYDRFCNDQGCLNRVPGTDNALTTLDEDHITPAAARYLVKGLKQQYLDPIGSYK